MAANRTNVKNILMKANPKLREYLNLNDDFLVALKATNPGVITDAEHEEINLKTTHGKIDHLLYLIKRRDVDVYSSFMGVLQQKDLGLYNDVKLFEDEEFRGREGPLQDPQPIVQPNQVQTVVSGKDLAAILVAFGIADLEDVYIQLGLKQKEIDDAKLEGNTPKEKAKKVLNLWCKRNAKAATRENMIKAMEACPDYKASTDELKREWGYDV